MKWIDEKEDKDDIKSILEDPSKQSIDDQVDAIAQWAENVICAMVSDRIFCEDCEERMPDEPDRDESRD